MFKESKLRSIIKSLSWRLLATMTTILIVYIFVGNTKIAFSIGGIEVFLKMLVYFIHERVWEKIRFGRREVKPLVIWITGLSRSGKSGIGRLLTEKLRQQGFKAEHLDGHSIRDLFPETGYSRKDVNRHIKRVGFLARKLEEQGVIVVATFLSPYEESREFIREITARYFEVYISTPAEVCAARDRKGVYAQATAGVLKNFPGISLEYEIPKNPDLTINTAETSQKEAAKIIFSRIKKNL